MVGVVVHILRESASGQERVFVHDMETLGEEKFVVALARECESRTPILEEIGAPKKQEEAKLAIGDGNDARPLPIKLPGKKLLKKGRRVVILSGAYKTQLAEIREEIDEEYVRVQLLTKPKMMQLHKKQIAFHDMPTTSNADMLEDLPPMVPSTPVYEIEAGTSDTQSQMNELEDDLASNGADPWDMRFKLPAPIRKKADAAWDPTFRKPKNARSVAAHMSTPQSAQLEDARSVTSGRDQWNNAVPGKADGDADNRSVASARSAANPLLEIMDSDRSEPMDVDDNLLNPIPDLQAPATPVSARSRRSARTLVSKKSANGEDNQAVAQQNPSSPSSGRNLPTWCQKGVKVQVDGKVGHISVVLFSNLFVIFSDSTTEKYAHDQVTMAPLAVGDVVLCFGDMKYLNKVGTCKSVDTSARQATIDFKGEGVVSLSLSKLAAYKYKSHMLEDDGVTADAQSDSQSNAGSLLSGLKRGLVRNSLSPLSRRARSVSPLSRLRATQTPHSTETSNPVTPCSIQTSNPVTPHSNPVTPCSNPLTPHSNPMTPMSRISIASSSVVEPSEITADAQEAETDAVE